MRVQRWESVASEPRQDQLSAKALTDLRTQIADAAGVDARDVDCLRAGLAVPQDVRRKIADAIPAAVNAYCSSFEAGYVRAGGNVTAAKIAADERRRELSK